MLGLCRVCRALVILFRGLAARICSSRERCSSALTTFGAAPVRHRPKKKRHGPKRKKPGTRPGLKFGGRREVKFSQVRKLLRKAQERRSADQVPEHSPEAAVQVPPPSVPDMWPVPVALLSPRETVTVTAPFAPTLPVTLKEAVPA